SPASGFTAVGVEQPFGIAIDQDGAVWSANRRWVPKLESSGTPAFGSPFMPSAGITKGRGIAITSLGSAWLANNGLVANKGSVLKLGTDGTTLKVVTAQNFPYWVAIDGSENIWVTSNDGAQLTRIKPAGSPVSFFSGGGLSNSSGLAIDTSGNVWVSSTDTSVIAEFDNSGTPLSGGGFTGGGLSVPVGIAIDGAGNLWIANSGGGSLTEMNASGNPLSPATGFADPNLSSPLYDAIDASGNLWVSNNSGSSVTEFIGAASPVKTPLIGPPQAP